MLRDEVCCQRCKHLVRGMCRRDEVAYEPSYNRTYTDSDFCGPTGRFFQPRTLFQRMTDILTETPHD